MHASAAHVQILRPHHDDVHNKAKQKTNSNYFLGSALLY